MDLSRFENLSVLRVKGCDLQGVERFAFPSGLEAFAIGGALFARGAALDLSGCHQMKIFDVDASFENKEIALSRITFPEEIEEIKLCGLKFSEIESFDLRAYPNLRCADVERSAFPKLRKLLLPAGCELKRTIGRFRRKQKLSGARERKSFRRRKLTCQSIFAGIEV